MNETFCIYMIRNLINDKKYIGCSIDFERRLKEHLQVANGNNTNKQKLLHKAIAKYGIDNFEIKIIQETSSHEEMVKLEIYWIDFYKTNIIRYGRDAGYNLTDGGEGCGLGPKSDEHKMNISNGLKGIKKSREHCSNLRKAKYKFTYEEVRRIIELLLQDISQYKIAKQFGVSQGIISDIKIGKSYQDFISQEDLDVLKTRTTKHSGEKNSSAKLTTIQAKEIKLLLTAGELSIKQIADKYRVSKKIVEKIKRRETWKNI